LRQVELLLDKRRLGFFAAENQAFMQPVQRPQINGVLAGPG
jgi:hypothetical protein